MRPTPVFIAALLATTAPLAMRAASPTPTATPAPAAPTVAPATVAGQRVEITFVNPDKFTDVRDSYPGTDSGRDAILDQIKEYMTDQAARFIPPGDRLLISVTDIDLAGDFEPWRGPQWDDVRVVKDIYPPRMDLSFRLTDSSGRVVKEGKRELRNPTFQMEMTMAFRDDPLRYEKQLIEDWLRDEFPRVKK